MSSNVKDEKRKADELSNAADKCGKNDGLILANEKLVEEKNHFDFTENSLECVSKEVNKHVRDKMEANDFMFTSTEADSNAAEEQATTLIYSMNKGAEVSGHSSKNVSTSDVVKSRDSKSKSISSEKINEANTEIKQSISNSQTSNSSSASSVFTRTTGGVVVKRRYIIKAERSFSKNGKKRISSSSWNEGSFGFGSIDLNAELNLKTKTKGKASVRSKLKVFQNLSEKWGWAVVAASCLIMIPIVGVLSSYGILLDAIVDEFQSTRLAAGWVGSLVFGLAVGLCPLSNILIKAYGSRLLVTIGIVGATLSVLITSFVPTLHLMFLTYSVFLGTFVNLVYNSVLTLTGQYFLYKHQAFATCLATSGISFGTVIFNPICRKLVDAQNWRYTYRILAAIIFVVGMACTLIFRPAPPPVSKDTNSAKQPNLLQKQSLSLEGKTPLNASNIRLSSAEKQHDESSKSSSEHIKTKQGLLKEFGSVFNKDSFDCSLCSNPAFVLWMLGTLLWSNAFLFPIIFLVDYMRTLGISPERGAFVLTAYGMAEFAGRVMCALFAGKLPFSMAFIYAGSTFVGGVATLVAPTGKDLVTMYAYSIGINSGIVNSLMFAATMQFFSNEKGLHVWGYINFALSIGMVGGPVVAGAIYDFTQSYQVAFYVGGILFLICCVVMTLIPYALRLYPVEQPKPKAEQRTVRSIDENPFRAKRRRARKRSFRKKSEESLRRKVLRLSVTKETLTQNVEEVKQNPETAASV